MPRKTNKTAHVLNLLASGAPTDETATENKKDPEGQIANISISNPTSPSDPLANLIKDHLENELEANATTKSPPTVEASTPSNTNTTTVTENPVQPTTTEAVVQPINQATATETTVQPTIQATPAEATAQPTIQATLAEATVQPTIQATPAEPTIETTATEATVQPVTTPQVQKQNEETFILLNLTEQLVENRLDEFMERFDTCTCSRCRVDAKAIALTNLQPKYLVIQKEGAAPLISFHANRQNTSIVTELTKACLAIINNPRH